MLDWDGAMPNDSPFDPPSPTTPVPSGGPGPRGSGWLRVGLVVATLWGGLAGLSTGTQFAERGSAVVAVVQTGPWVGVISAVLANRYVARRTRGLDPSGLLGAVGLFAAVGVVAALAGSLVFLPSMDDALAGLEPRHIQRGSLSTALMAAPFVLFATRLGRWQGSVSQAASLWGSLGLCLAASFGMGLVRGALVVLGVFPG